MRALLTAALLVPLCGCCTKPRTVHVLPAPEPVHVVPADRSIHARAVPAGRPHQAARPAEFAPATTASDAVPEVPAPCDDGT